MGLLDVFKKQPTKVTGNPFGTKRVETTYTRVEMTPEAMEKARRDVERKALEMRAHDLEGKG